MLNVQKNNKETRLKITQCFCNCQQADDNKLIDCTLELRIVTDDDLSDITEVKNYLIDNNSGDGTYTIRDEKTDEIIAIHQDFEFERINISFDQNPVILAIFKKQFEA